MSPNPHVGAVIVRDGEVTSARASTASSAAARRGRGDPQRRRAGPRRRDACTCRSSRAAIRGARRPAPMRSVRPGISRVVVASDDPSEHASGRGLGILRDEGIEVVVADGEIGGPGAAPEPAVSQARPHRAAVGAVQVGDVAGRQGRDAQRRLEVDLRRPPAVSSSTSGGRPVDAVAVGIGTALADDPLLTARVGGSDSNAAIAPAAPGGVRLARADCR